MRIVMMTNTFAPHVGGVARSVEAVSGELRQQGHQVLVVAPEFPDMPQREESVVRVRAVQRFNGSDFSFPVPAPAHLRARLDVFRPHVVHSHHPFLLGDTALRVAAERRLPIVFTHHTMYERYTHYVPGDSPAMKRGAVALAAGYCNLCNAVIAPSESIAMILRRRGVQAPIETIPTGVDLTVYGAGDRESFRGRLGIPEGAFVVGHLGRLAPQKNIPLVTGTMIRFLVTRPEARALVVGDGPSSGEVAADFDAAGLGDRLHLAPSLPPAEVADAYAAMDAFLFASATETQGMVVTEAMAAGTPVVAVDANGVRDVVRDRVNGRLTRETDPDALVTALFWLADLGEEPRNRLVAAARATARCLSLPHTTRHLLKLYASLRRSHVATAATPDSRWQKARARLAEEWRIARNVAQAVEGSLRPEAP